MHKKSVKIQDINAFKMCALQQILPIRPSMLRVIIYLPNSFARQLIVICFMYTGMSNKIRILYHTVTHHKGKILGIWEGGRLPFWHFI